MRRAAVLTIIAGIVASGIVTPARAQQDAQVLTLSSPDFVDGGVIDGKYTCDGAGQSPPLHIANAPSHTESFALTVIDPDAPGGAFAHWLAYNLPGTVRDIPAGAAGSAGLGLGAQQGINASGQASYAPPCPANGEHHYIFRLYALSATLALPTGTSVDKKGLDAALLGHVLAQGELTGRYARHAAP